MLYIQHWWIKNEISYCDYSYLFNQIAYTEILGGQVHLPMLSLAMVIWVMELMDKVLNCQYFALLVISDRNKHLISTNSLLSTLKYT